MNILRTQFLYGMKIIEEGKENYKKKTEENEYKSLPDEDILEFSLKVSTGIHVIRRTLDHAMWHLVKDKELLLSNHSLNRLISFPSFSENMRFNNWRNKVKDLYSDDLLNFVELLQPYNENVFSYTIQRLSLYDNSAKHFEPLTISQYEGFSEEFSLQQDDLGRFIIGRDGNLLYTETRTPVVSPSYKALIREGDKMGYKDFTFELGPRLFNPLGRVINRLSTNDYAPFTMRERDMFYHWDGPKEPRILTTEEIAFIEAHRRPEEEFYVNEEDAYFNSPKNGDDYSI